MVVWVFMFPVGLYSFQSLRCCSCLCDIPQDHSQPMGCSFEHVKMCYFNSWVLLRVMVISYAYLHIACFASAHKVVTMKQGLVWSEI